MNAKKTETVECETLEEFCAIHLECLDEIKAMAETADEGQPQPFCAMELEVIEAGLTRVLTACWNSLDNGDDTEEIEVDLDEEIDEKNGEEKTD